jgi:hypothetical protein
MWKTGNIFVDMDRNFYTYDGDMYKKKFDGKREHSKSITFKHDYKNKIKASRSIFGFTKLKDCDVKKLKLHDYPELITQTKENCFFGNDLNQNPFLGYKPTKAELNRFQFINGYYGPRKQFRVFLLFFYNKPHSVVEDQRSYWEGGNKNEMIMCFGLDSVTKKIQWVDAFSWCDKPTFAVKFRDYMNGKEKLNLTDIANFTEYGATHYWVRKDFKDFDYIKVELTNTQLIWLFIIVLLFNIGMSLFIVLNNIDYNTKL